MKIKVINDDSPILRQHGVKIGMIGEVLENDFKEKYQYKVRFSDIKLALYFYADEVEEIKE